MHPEHAFTQKFVFLGTGSKIAFIQLIWSGWFAGMLGSLVYFGHSDPF
jgi:hypothetical protein